jgi:hypothetical protein
MAARRLVVILLLVGLVGTMIAGALSLGGQRPETVNGFARQPVHWYLLDIEGETISLAYALTGVSSDCEREATGVVDEDDERVVVTAFKEVTTDAGRACTEEIAIVDAEVRLSAPLGDRALVGCRPPLVDADEDEVCRDLDRSDEVGVLDIPR